MIRVYLRDPIRPYAAVDMENISPLVTECKVREGGIWIMFGVPLTGRCEREVIDLLGKTHINQSRKYAEGVEVFRNVVLELDSMEDIEHGSFQPLDEEE